MPAQVVGRRVPVLREVAPAVGPAAAYAKTRDIPNVLGLADYVGAVDDTLALVQRRVRAGRVGAEMAMFPLVKADPTTTDDRRSRVSHTVLRWTPRSVQQCGS